MKTLCLGGSFNPIHHGHLICARAVAESAGFSKILLIPSRQPPHKQPATDLADASDRLNMCRVAIQTTPVHSAISFEVSELEMSRAGPSYTIDTVRELRKSGWPEVHWLIGADMLNYLPNWHNPAALLQETRFVIVNRPGIAINWSSLPPEFIPMKNSVVEAPLIDISSTDIRRRVQANLSIDYLTPTLVVEYIKSHRLYL
jgi:nicotinate-nucleotide adenylyltransferase